MTSRRVRRAVFVLVATALLCLVLTAPAMAGKTKPPPPPTPSGDWVTGDTHNHTHFSDGNQYLPQLVYQAFSVWGLDYLGSTDHGGEWDRDANGDKYEYWDIIDNDTGDVWAWDAMLDNWDSFDELRAQYPGKVLFQGLEWGVPGVDESKTVVLDQFQDPTNPDYGAPSYETGMGISDFEFLFDKLDDDFTQDPTIGTVLGWPDATGTTEERYSDYDKTPWNYDKPARGYRAAEFLRDEFGASSYSILSHPSRDLLWTVGEIRRYNDIAPDTFFGMAGIPGSQKEEPSRGGYDTDDWTLPDGSIDYSIAQYARTYGGADYLTAKLGGGWDALLGEGRNFWIFSDSDFHNPDEEFWPGEYSKDHVFVDAKTPQGIVDGLRRGCSFSVEAQLIDKLDFTAAAGTKSAMMGGTLTATKGATVTVTVKWHSPKINNHGDVPKVDHVDLISGNVTGKLAPAQYDTVVTNPSTKVATRWFTSKLRAAKDGTYSASYSIKVTGDMYLRLRGTNQGLNVFNQTDANGNPLMDDLEGLNDDVKCWMDIWFYSNPIFIDVQ